MRIWDTQMKKIFKNIIQFDNLLYICINILTPLPVRTARSG